MSKRSNSKIMVTAVTCFIVQMLRHTPPVNTSMIKYTTVIVPYRVQFSNDLRVPSRQRIMLDIEFVMESFCPLFDSHLWVCLCTFVRFYMPVQH